MDDQAFQALFQRIVDQYELAPDVAEELLRQILKILSECSLEEEFS